MKPLNFEISIQASPAKVWETLWNDSTYRLWTAPFSAGSYAKSNWKEGGRIHFLNPEGSGMYSEIEKLELYKTMVFKHLGEIKNKQEQQLNETNKDWYGGRESYFLSEHGSQTMLKVSVDTPDNFSDYMNEKFPKALEELKRLCERNSDK